MKQVPVHERVRQVLVELLLADPEGAAIDYGRDVVSQGKGGHGKHGTRSTPPPRIESKAVEYAEAFRRLADMAELELAGLKGTAQLQPRRVGGAGRVGSELARDRKRRIVSLAIYRGRPHEFVAYVEGCSADLVRKVRGERGLDSHGLKPEGPGPVTSRRLPEIENESDQEV